MTTRALRSVSVLALVGVLAGGAGIAVLPGAVAQEDALVPRGHSLGDASTTTSAGSRAALAPGPIIIDHTCTDVSRIPPYWIERAKEQLRASYGHTSHGSQVISGMGALMGGSLNVDGLYDFNTDGDVEADILSIADYTPSGDLGNPDRTTWAARTCTYLDGTGSDRNVVVWSWCGQVDTTEPNIDLYLGLMNDLEQDYPDVAFVYMTGHLDGTGVDGNVNVRNNQIRNYCVANDKVLFDFADIESYDPDGDSFLDLGADDECNYSGGNWADEWCAAHPGDPLCDSCSCLHSRPLNCNLKARAFWWMMARLAGWDGGETVESEARKTVSAAAPTNGQTITYTIAVRNITTTATLTDQVPLRLSYLTKTLTATLGAVDDGDVPTLRWSGDMSGSSAVTVTYAVTVSTIITTPSVISNTAFVAAPAYGTISSTATIIVNGYTAHLPLVLRDG